eukprot:783171-Pelagomonas_calceolata.AAC.8
MLHLELYTPHGKKSHALRKYCYAGSRIFPRRENLAMRHVNAGMFLDGHAIITLGTLLVGLLVP